jgi:hypothetical protein
MNSLTLIAISHKIFLYFFHELVIYYGIIHNPSFPMGEKTGNYRQWLIGVFPLTCLQGRWAREFPVTGPLTGSYVPVQLIEKRDTQN